MDPISVLGSVAAILEVSGGVLKLIRTLKDGEKDFGELLEHVTFFRDTLEAFDRVLRNRSAKVPSETFEKVMKKGFETIKELEKKLLQIHKSENSAVRRVKWAQSKTSLEKLEERIKTQCSMLHSWVSVAQMELFFDVCSQYPRFNQICARLAEELESEHRHSYAPNTAIVSSTVQNSELPFRVPEIRVSEADPLVASRRQSGTSLTVPDMWTTSSRSSMSSAISSVFSSDISMSSSSSIASSVKDDSQARSQSGKTEPSDTSPEALVIRRSCRFDCYCKCHSQGISVESEALSTFDPSVFKGTKRQKVECTEPDCAGSQKRPVPHTFMKRAISHLMTSKVQYALNTYRMVPEGSDAMRYVKQGNLDKLKMCIRLGEATPWDTAPDGWSLLHTAAYARQLPAVKYLCELGVDTEAADIGARKPVDLAILKSLTADASKVEKEIVRLFFKGDDPFLDFEFTPIHIAVLDLYDPSDHERPSLEKLIDFLDNANNAPPGTDWSRWKARFRKRSPLFLAIIEQFRASAVEVSNTRKVIHNLLDQKDRKFHWTPLHWASATGRVAKMKVLVDSGADPFIQSNLNANIVHAAVESNALSTLSYSLDICKTYPKKLSIDQPNIWGESPLIMASQGCLVGCVKLLLEAGASRSIQQENQQVALHYCGLSKPGPERYQTLSLLCDGVDGAVSCINAQDEDGRPPIFDFLDDAECMSLLIRHGAKIDLIDNSGKTILHHACIKDENEQLKTLLERCENTAITPRQKDNDGNSPLIQALRHGSVSCAMTLLELDDVGDMVGQDGWAAVHYAVKLGNATLLEKVLKHGCFVKGLSTGDGKTAQVVAMEAGVWCGRIKELLRKYNSM